MRSMIATNYEIAHMIRDAPLSISTTDIIDEIEEKYSIRLNYSTVQRAFEIRCQRCKKRN